MNRSVRWKNRLNQVTDLLFPPVCAACLRPAKRPAFLCAPCVAKIRYLSSPVCTRCGRPFMDSGGGDHLCGGCINSPPPFSIARSLCIYAPPVSNLLQKLKFRADRTVLASLRDIAADFDRRAFLPVDMIVPVPLFSKRLRKRGLNQSHLLARLLFPDRRELIVPELLVRVRDTIPQTRLDSRQRRRNLKAAFVTTGNSSLAGKRVLVVDDVFTTGTTVGECAQALLTAGVAEVRVVTMARVVPRDPAGFLF